MIQNLTDENYKSIIDGHFEKNETVVCMIINSLQCVNCKMTKKNIESTPSNLHFYYVDYTKYDILQNYYQLNDLLEFPQTIVYYGNWKDKEFLEGVITSKKIVEIDNK